MPDSRKALAMVSETVGDGGEELGLLGPPVTTRLPSAVHLTAANCSWCAVYGGVTEYLVNVFADQSQLGQVLVRGTEVSREVDWHFSCQHIARLIITVDSDPNFVVSLSKGLDRAVTAVCHWHVLVSL